jgi:transposase
VDRLPDSGHGSAGESGAIDEQTTEAEPLAGLQGEGGDRGDQGRTDDCTDRGAVRRSPEPAWKAQLEGGAPDVFDNGTSSAQEPAVDVKALHAKIGELTLENDFLEGALSKAGLLNAKR